MTSSPLPVVAGVSGSPASRQAVRAAAREAGARGHPLRLVHAFDWSPGAASHPQAAGDLLRQAKSLATCITPGLPVTTEVIEGHPLPGLLRLSHHAALTVIGDGDLNDRVCLPREATAVQVAARAFGTVLITRAVPPPAGPVLVGVNGHGVSERLLDVAFGEAVRLRTGVLVIHVGEHADRVPLLEEAVAALARTSDIDASLRILHGEATAVLRREARDAGLVVVGARGDLPYHGLLGSVTQTLLHHGRGPILVVRGIRLSPLQRTRTDGEASLPARAPIRDSEAGTPRSIQLPFAQPAEGIA